MNDDIIKLLNIKQKEIKVIEVITDDDKGVLYIHIERQREVIFCPECGFRMHSKGVTKRNVNYPILHNGYKLKLIVHQRRYYCSNPNCSYTYIEKFNFLERYKHNANIVPVLVLRDLKDLNVTAVQVAKKYNISDTQVHNYIMEYLNPKRLPLPQILSVDEVHLEFDSKNKYALVLMNFITGDIVDILPNRLNDTYEPYFLDIPLEERKKVKIIVCDMYNPYINFSYRYFPNALVVVDSFHVIQWINNKITVYINEVKKKYLKRDEKIRIMQNEKNVTDYKKIKTSNEVYLLNHYRYFLLSDKHNINYYSNSIWNKHLHMYTDTYRLEHMFMELDPNFRKIREQKQLYLDFNHRFPMEIIEATDKLDKLIEYYKKSELAMFREFSELLKKNREYIINSFLDPKTVCSKEYEKEYEIVNKTLRRVSNGPIESFNRKPKDLKRNSRGFSNINYTIFRLIWANREDEPILAIPKKEKEIHKDTGIKRGPYNKKK